MRDGEPDSNRVARPQEDAQAGPARLRRDLLRYLKVRERSRREASDHLARRGYPRDEIARALAEAVESGWIDDRRFAEMFLRDRRRLHPMSQEMVARQLRARGVGAEIVTETLAACDPPWDDDEMAVAAIARRWLRWAPETREERARRYLVSRGFGRGAIRAALARMREQPGRNAGREGSIDADDRT